MMDILGWSTGWAAGSYPEWIEYRTHINFTSSHQGPGLNTATQARRQPATYTLSERKYHTVSAGIIEAARGRTLRTNEG